jgi:hypothetical protein
LKDRNSVLKHTSIVLHEPGGTTLLQTFQDRDIEQKFTLDEQTDRAAETFIRFLDAQAANIHLAQGQIQFDNDTDAGTAKQLADKLFALQDQKYPELPQRAK